MGQGTINTHIHTFQVRLDLVDLNNSCYDCWSETPAILQVDDRTERWEEVDLEGSQLQEVTLKKLPELSLYYRFFIVFLSRSSNIKTIDLFSPETQVSITYDLMYIFPLFLRLPWTSSPRHTKPPVTESFSSAWSSCGSSYFWLSWPTSSSGWQGSVKSPLEEELEELEVLELTIYTTSKIIFPL